MRSNDLHVQTVLWLRSFMGGVTHHKGEGIGIPFPGGLAAYALHCVELAEGYVELRQRMAPEPAPPRGGPERSDE